MSLAKTQSCLRDPSPEERAFGIQRSGYSRASCVWISDSTDGGRCFIVFPDLGIEGVAFALSSAGQELWRKSAFYTALMGAGYGFEARHNDRIMNVRLDIDGSWIPSVNGELAPGETPIYDERAAKQITRDFAGVDSAVDLNWSRSQD